MTNLRPMVKPLGLTQQEKADLVAFLKALIGEPIKFEMPKFPKQQRMSEVSGIKRR